MTARPVTAELLNPPACQAPSGSCMVCRNLRARLTRSSRASRGCARAGRAQTKTHKLAARRNMSLPWPRLLGRRTGEVFEVALDDPREVVAIPGTHVLQHDAAQFARQFAPRPAGVGFITLGQHA